MSGATSQLRLHQPLVLAARLAATTFCRRHLKRISPWRPSSWTPVLLRWSRKVVGARAGASPRAPGWTGLWVSHLHLHLQFAGAPGAAAAPTIGQAHSIASPGGLLTLALARCFASLKSRRLVNDPSELFRGPMRATKESTASGVRTALASVGRARFAATFEAMAAVLIRKAAAAAGAAPAPSEQFALATKAASHSTTRATVWPTIFGGTLIRTRIQAHSNIGVPSLTHVCGSRSFLRQKREQPSAGVPEASPERVRRPSELTWSRNRGDSKAADDFSQVPTPTAQAVASARSTAAAPHGLTPASRTSKAVVCATTLDPMLADRLADDVIRRIDRRARIERERRGP